MVYCGMHDESFVVHSLVLLVQCLKPLVCFAFMWRGKSGEWFPTVVSLFATVVTVTGQRIPDILKLIMMTPYSLN